MRATVTTLGVMAMSGLVLTVAAGAATSPTPQAVYRALLASSVPASQLPAGFAASKTSAGTADSGEAQHHAIGAVEISVDYGDTTIRYVVFATRQDALAAWQSSNVGAATGVTSRHVPAGFPAPALIANGSVSKTDALNEVISTGFTSLGFVDGNVGVTVSNQSNTRSSSGNVGGAVALAKFALGHLHAVETRAH